MVINTNFEISNNIFDGVANQQAPKFDFSPTEKKNSKKDSVEISDEYKSEKDKNNPQELSDKEQKQVDNLKKRDAEVRRHEQAHIAAAAGLNASGPFYQYTTGPDGRKYATGGEVRIDNSPEKEPEETIRKMQRVRAAALAPANPSSQDRKVASKASQTEAKARQELAQEKAQEMKQGLDLNSNDNQNTVDIQNLVSTYQTSTSTPSKLNFTA